MAVGTDTVVDELALPARLALAVAACGSVIPLLAWVSRLGPFSVWGLVVGLPLVVAVVAVHLVGVRAGRWRATTDAIVAGVLGGLVGTLGYDVFRIPFVAIGGLQLLAPIDSYGVLLLDAASSSPLTGFAAWTYHTTNGVGFAIAYAVVARGRHWGWGVAWAMVLESATVVSPFAAQYQLVTDDGVKVLPIVLAYLAHVPYGYAIGRAAQHADALAAAARRVTARPALVALVLVAVGFGLWQRPLVPQEAVDAGRGVADGASAVVRGDRLVPAWLRVPADGGCATIRNDDPADVAIGDLVTIAPGETGQVCADDVGEGVHRLRVADAPFSGGWLIADPYAD